ncbi:hypothetical protein AVEN_168316-1, partial [Araneus ventricosus]
MESTSPILIVSVADSTMTKSEWYRYDLGCVTTGANLTYVINEKMEHADSTMTCEQPE